MAESKFDRLKKFIDGTIKNEVLGGSGREKSMREVFQYYMTKIQMVNANGYEYFYVANWKLGHRRWAAQENLSSRWYRAVSSESGKAQRLAQLNLLGITNSVMDQIQFNHYLTQNSSKTQWSDFAHRVINGDCLINQDMWQNPRKICDKGMFKLILDDSYSMSDSLWPID